MNRSLDFRGGFVYYYANRAKGRLYYMEKTPREINHSFRVRGEGGQGACMAVQSVLQEHGLCGYTEWNSPNWYFMYLTHLDCDAVMGLLGGLTRYYRIQVQNGSERP
jgi:hypothetical protein